MEYHTLVPKMTDLLHSNVVVVLWDDAGLVDAEQLTKDIKAKIVGNLKMEANISERKKIHPRSEIYAKAGEYAEALKIEASPMKPTKTRKKGWKFTISPLPDAILERATSELEV